MRAMNHVDHGIRPGCAACALWEFSRICSDRALKHWTGFVHIPPHQTLVDKSFGPQSPQMTMGQASSLVRRFFLGEGVINRGRRSTTKQDLADDFGTFALRIRMSSVILRH
jgi:hypothetical protein